MNISDSSRSGLGHLVTLAQHLVTKLVEAGNSEDGGVADAIDILRRFLSLLLEGLATDSLDTVLRATNGLQSVNKGLNDLVVTAIKPEITGLGFQTSKDAIAMSKQLRIERSGLLKY